MFYAARATWDGLISGFQGRLKEGPSLKLVLCSALCTERPASSPPPLLRVSSWFPRSGANEKQAEAVRDEWANSLLFLLVEQSCKSRRYFIEGEFKQLCRLILTYSFSSFCVFIILMQNVGF